MTQSDVNQLINLFKGIGYRAHEAWTADGRLAIRYRGIVTADAERAFLDLRTLRVNKAIVKERSNVWSVERERENIAHAKDEAEQLAGEARYRQSILGDE